MQKSISSYVYNNLFLKQEANNSTHKPFVVITSGRSGSSWIMSLLDSHTQVISLYETMRKTKEEEMIMLQGLSPDKQQQILTFRNKNPILFMDTLLSGSYPTAIKTVGFKILYAHASLIPSTFRFMGIWKYINKNKEMKIIHSKRKNLLRTFVSSQIAKKTNAWTSKEKITLPKEKITLKLNPFYCLIYFITISVQSTIIDWYYRKNQKIYVYYEDLIDDFSSEATKIQSFLNIQPTRLTSIYKKQNTKALSETITNYSYLKTFFKYTPWSTYFEE